MSEPVNIHYAKTHLSRLIKLVREGAVITIAHAGEPVARLVPVELDRPRKPGGFDFGVDDDFFAPLPDDELDAWGR
jgi:prevent-host-death family protein